MRRLGAIIAGGKASRFGGDKPAALLNGRTLIDHVAGGLRGQTHHMIICGRHSADIESVADHPSPDLGPLGGLNAALRYACEHGFDAVVTAGCDVLPVPQMPETTDTDAAMFLDGHYLFGIWPASLARSLDRHLSSQSDHSMRRWIAVTGAQSFAANMRHYNLNTKADLVQYAATLQAGST